MEHGGHDNLGQILPLVALLVAMALGLAVLTVETARLVGERAVAQAAVAARRRIHFGRRPGRRAEQGP